jgi:hypothetical protein
MSALPVSVWKGTLPRKALFAYIPDLKGKVIQLLDQNPISLTTVLSIPSSRQHRLTTHDFIPQDEIWMKLNEDKGGKTMKASFQICNCPNPNSPANTCVFGLFEAADSVTNLHTTLDRYSSQGIERAYVEVTI